MAFTSHPILLLFGFQIVHLDCLFPPSTNCLKEKQLSLLEFLRELSVPRVWTETRLSPWIDSDGERRGGGGTRKEEPLAPEGMKQLLPSTLSPGPLRTCPDARWWVVRAVWVICHSGGFVTASVLSASDRGGWNDNSGLLSKIWSSFLIYKPWGMALDPSSAGHSSPWASAVMIAFTVSPICLGHQQLMARKAQSAHSLLDAERWQSLTTS